MPILTLFRRRGITFDQLQMIQLIAFQLVCSLEQESEIPKEERRSIACEETQHLIGDLSIEAPFSVIESAVDCSLCVVTRRQEKALGPTSLYNVLPERFRAGVS